MIYEMRNMKNIEFLFQKQQDQLLKVSHSAEEKKNNDREKRYKMKT